MPAVIDPVTGLELYELSHRWACIRRSSRATRRSSSNALPITQARRDDAQDHHDLSHLDASERADPPRARRAGGRDLELQKFFGTGVVLSLPKKKWGLIEPSDLERAKPAIKAGDIVLINTGWHRKYADSKEYFGYAPGLSKHAADWLVKKRVKLVGVDTACNRSSAGDVAWAASQRPQINICCRNTRKLPAAGDQGFSGMECGAPHVA